MRQAVTLLEHATGFTPTAETQRARQLLMKLKQRPAELIVKSADSPETRLSRRISKVFELKATRSMVGVV